MNKKYILIETTFEKREDAVKMAQLLLEAALAACGQICEIESLYNWSGERCQEKEFLLTLKTRMELYAKCERLIKAHHPYKTPQITAKEILCGSKEYLDWIDESVKEINEQE